ncbi:MAG: ribosomal RNA small subunit methyltransferase A [Sedimentisphaerales bacterium]|nr:ribosomal RNA small subunit methyltransferase A [Sedimentisphaerales bacterium]
MHTKQQIRELLAAANYKPKHRRGQNFLIDLNLMRLLVQTADIRKNDIVLEIGCGTGSLTGALAEKAAKVVAVEIEGTLAGIAERELKDRNNVEIIVCDVLESKNVINSKVIGALEKAQRERDGRLLLVANLPYSVASPVMLNLVTGEMVADCMYVTVQKEVAERMTARPGGKDYGGLSIMLAATGDIKIERKLKPSVFWPEPQVDSAMVSFVRNDEKCERIYDMKILGEVVALFMQHRRKMLKSCTKLAQGRLEKIHNWTRIFQDCAVEPQKRPEELPPADYISIANLCAEQLKSLL